MTGALSPSHWLIIVVVLLLLFGAKRLPDAARGVGRSLRIFKAETAALSGDDSPADSTGAESVPRLDAPHSSTSHAAGSPSAGTAPRTSHGSAA